MVKNSKMVGLARADYRLTKIIIAKQVKEMSERTYLFKPNLENSYTDIVNLVVNTIFNSVDTINGQLDQTRFIQYLSIFIFK